MNKILKFTCLSFCMVFNSLNTIMAQGNNSPNTAKAVLDSTTMIMGSTTALHVEFTGQFVGQPQILTNEAAWGNVELTPTTVREKIEKLGNDRIQVSREYLVQAFDSGVYTLPPFYIITAEAETIRTNSPVLKVDPISLDSSYIAIEDGKMTLKINESNIDVIDEDYQFWDFLPEWVTNYWPYLLIIILVVIFLAFVYFKWLRHGELPLKPHRKIIPPYQLAISQLRDLQSRQLWQQGAEKEYYTQLTDILRTYISGRFGVYAMEMTTEQIMESISDDMVAHEDKDILYSVLSQADYVKFAKARPFAHENEQSFNMALRFIEDTKPREQVDNEPNLNGDNDDLHKSSPKVKETK